MARKKFEEDPYNPIDQELARQAGNRISMEAQQEPLPVNKEEVTPQVKIKRKVQAPSEQKPLSVVKSPSKSKREVKKKDDLEDPFSITEQGRKRTFCLPTVNQDNELNEFIDRIRRHSNTRVSAVALVRAGLQIVMRSEEQLYELLKKTPSPAQPSTLDKQKSAEFEDFWNDIFAEAARLRRPMQ